jgi:erythromycin esterase-like protein
MKNDECTIYISTKRGYTQIYRREKNGWTQTSPNGKIRKLSAEQLLSHMLPSLAGVGPLKIRVEPIKNKK